MMKKLFCFVCFTLLATPTQYFAETSVETQSEIGVVNLQRCLEESLLGKKEQEELDRIKKRFSKSIGKLEEELKSMYSKLQDEEYMEGLSQTASDELRKDFEEKTGEYQVLMSQYQQELNQRHVKRLQKVFDEVKKASQIVRQKKNLSLILNEEVVLAAPNADQTEAIIKILDESFESN